MENKLPDIQLSFKKFYSGSYTKKYIRLLIEDKAGVFYPDDNIIILSYGDFTKELLKEYNRTIEKQACNTISHEIIHWWILKELNIKACSAFDNIAKNLFEYGVY